MSLENRPSFVLNLSEAEMNGEDKHSYSFKSFNLNIGERQLLRNDEAISLTPKAFDVLACLVTRGGHLVEKEELMHSVWPDSFVEETNLTRIVHTLRKALGDDGNGNSFIETVPTKGYRFVADVEFRAGDAQKSTIGEPDIPATNEKIPDTEHQMRSAAIDEESAPLVTKPRHPMRVILFAVGFASAVALLFLLSFNLVSKSSISPNKIQSVAVLPLKPLTPEKRDAIYELGIADALILKLSMAKNLVVRQLSSTQGYVDDKKDAVTIGKEQKVDFVLASNYQIADGRIRVTSQLINVSTGAVEEVFKDDEDTSNGFAVQDAVAANIGQSLLKRLGRESNNLTAKRYTTNEEAYRLYLLGTALADGRTKNGVAKAIEYFEQAISLDPNYALAYAGLANAETAVTIQGGNPTEQYLKAKTAIEKALAIDGSVAEAHSYLAEIKLTYEWDFAGAEREHKRAIELNPNSAAAHHMYALLLGYTGKFDDAVAEIKTAINLEPASVLNQYIFERVLYLSRRYDECISEGKRTLEMDADFPNAYSEIIASYRMKGEADQAFEFFIRERTRNKDKPEDIQSWKALYGQSGWRGIIGRQIEKAKEAEKTGNDKLLGLARLYAKIEDRESTLAYLERAFEKRSWGMIILKVDPSFDFLRSDPRFDDLLHRVNLK